MKHLFIYEWKLLLRNRAMVTAWLLLPVIGLYALYYGESFTNTQLKTIHTIDTAYQARVQTQLNNFTADTSTKEGKTKYRNAHDPFQNEWQTRPMAWKQPAGLQAFSIGQSDNQPFYYSLWVYNNVYNVKQVELTNPDKLMAGNFDLAFVFIYLLPLLIIAFTYNIASTDVENGTAGLLSTQGISLHSILVGRLLFRAGLIVASISVLSIAGALLNNVQPGAAISWWLISLLYTAFWFGLAYLFVARKNTGAVTALQLVSVWVVLLIVVPSLLNSRQKTDDKAWLEVADAARDYSTQLRELSKARLADTLFQVEPTWKERFQQKRDTTTLRSVAYAYFAMQNMNRIGRRIDSAALAQQRRIERYQWVNPSFAIQLLYNKLAGTELSSFIAFRKALSDYQLQRTERLSLRRMAGESIDRATYAAYPVFVQPAPGLAASDWVWTAAALIIYVVVCALAGRYYWKRL